MKELSLEEQKFLQYKKMLKMRTILLKLRNFQRENYDIILT